MPLIDQEFHALIPPLTPEEYQQLEANILSDGIREPLTTWQGILVDGHNRFEIAQKHGLEYRVLEKDFADRDAVIDWMICNQLGRRNLNPNQQSYLRGLQYEREKKKQAFKGNQHAKVGDDQNEHHQQENKLEDQNDPQPTTAERLATIHGVSAPTIRRDAEYAKAVDTVTANTAPEIKQQILNRDIGATKTDLLHLARMEPDQQKQAVAQVTTGEIKSISQYIKEQSKQDPDCKRIDREHAISRKVSDSLDLSVTTISDYDEAVAIYMDWEPEWTVDECVFRANQTIDHMNRLITAFQKIKKLRVVKT